MSTVRILLVEDSPLMLDLCSHALSEAKLDFAFERVERHEEVVVALRSSCPDLVITDFGLPDTDGIAVIRLVEELAPGVPVIVLAGSISEETAVECIKAGAADYVLKDRLLRLGPAVRRALDECRVRLEKQQALVRLRENEDLFRTVVENSIDVVTVVATDGTVRYVSPSVERLIGAAAAERIGRSVFELVHPDDLPAVGRAFQEVLTAPGRSLSAEFRLLHRDGDYRFVEARGTSFRGEGGATQVVINGRDVTARRAAEEELRLLISAMEEAEDAIVITAAPAGEGQRILFVNPAFSRMTGFDAAEVIGRSPDLLYGPETDAAVLARMDQALRAGRAFHGEALHYRKDRSAFSVEWRVAPIHDAGGDVTHFVSVERDVTERRRTEKALKDSEEQLRHAAKMEAVGRLSGGVAHDFNNLLTAISGYSELLAVRLGEGHPCIRDVEEIQRAAERAAVLTRQLLAFSRKQVLQPRTIEPDRILRDLERMLRRLIGEDVDLHFLLQATGAAVRVDPGQLEQVVMNLAVNARDAMPRGGRIALETGVVTLDAAAAGEQDVAAGEFVLLAVTDTGMGMDAETRAHVFEPFFTTKDPGQGTGLGLATAYGAIRQSGGTIQVESEPGRGSTFRVFLPRVAVAGEAGAAARLDPAATVGTETVLVAEDEDAIRLLIKSILSARGYTVLVARNGVEALDRLREPGGPIQLLLTDLVMPRMGGAELAEHVSRIHPATKVLFMSGYSEHPALPSIQLGPGAPFLAKPFRPDALLRKVREVLDEGDAGTTTR
jgi:PAS domain S-box-containing protein